MGPPQHLRCRRARSTAGLAACLFGPGLRAAGRQDAPAFAAGRDAPELTSPRQDAIVVRSTLLADSIQFSWPLQSPHHCSLWLSAGRWAATGTLVAAAVSRGRRKGRRRCRSWISAATAVDVALASPPSSRRAYVLGIGWYLLHFVVGLLNDGLMKFLGDSFPPFQIAFLRFTAAAAVLLPVMLLAGKEAFKTVSPWMHIVRGVLLALGMGLWCTGLRVMPFASCVVVNNTMPFFTMLFATVLLSEKVSKERWLASITGFVGLVLVFNPTAATFQPQSFVLLLSAMCFAMLDIFNKKYSVAESTLPMLFYGSVATALVSSPRAWATWVPVTATQYWLFGALGIGANLLLFCLLKAFHYVDASATCPYRYMEFVLSALFGFLFFGEMPGASTFWGSCIILPSVIYCAMAETRGSP